MAEAVEQRVEGAGVVAGLDQAVGAEEKDVARVEAVRVGDGDLLGKGAQAEGKGGRPGQGRHLTAGDQNRLDVPLVDDRDPVGRGVVLDQDGGDEQLVVGERFGLADQAPFHTGGDGGQAPGS